MKIQFPSHKFVDALIVSEKNNLKIPVDVLSKLFWNNMPRKPIPANKVKKRMVEIVKRNKKKFSREFYEFVCSDTNHLTRSVSKHIRKLANTHENLCKIAKSYKILENILGIKFKEKPKLFVVKQFPKPYHKIKVWDMFVPDKEDLNKYSIAAGVYVLQDNQYPILCELFIWHELVHFLMEQNKKHNIHIRWLEEALADIVSLIADWKKFKNFSRIKFYKNVLHIARKNTPNSPFAEYSNYDIVTKVFHRFGYKGIQTLARLFCSNGDKKFWSRLLFATLNDDFSFFTLPRFKPRTEFEFYITELFSFRDYLPVNAFSYKILNFILQKDKSKEEIFKKFGNKRKTNKSLRNLVKLSYISFEKKKYSINPSFVETLKFNFVKPVK